MAASEDLDLALELAGLADEITLARFRAEDLVVATKPDLTPVTEADENVEHLIRDRLAALRPQDGVVGEEFGDSGASARRWIIDPIDGTKNYVRGIPVWATLLALEVEGRIEAGVVSAPALYRRWWARRGEGAFTYDGRATRRLQASRVTSLGDSQLCFGGLEDWAEIGRLDDLLELGRGCWRTRGFGDILNYMLVAEGAVEIGMDPEAKLWDLAAPMIIVEEAGGRFTDLGGTPRADGGDGIATNGLVHDAALAIIGR
ncbi:MAG TPA: inositol monophosphatase family protein [Solirubrobacteraceae bacterium]|jgi:histidinol-phosphatase|nr:inositol monophosphatase family protein [Solirubrobacteraceae bacterium]